MTARWQTSFRSASSLISALLKTECEGFQRRCPPSDAPRTPEAPHCISYLSKLQVLRARLRECAAVTASNLAYFLFSAPSLGDAAPPSVRRALRLAPPPPPSSALLSTPCQWPLAASRSIRACCHARYAVGRIERAKGATHRGRPSAPEPSPRERLYIRPPSLRLVLDSLLIRTQKRAPGPHPM